jgi:hypothetical protein
VLLKLFSQSSLLWVEFLGNRGGWGLGEKVKWARGGNGTMSNSSVTSVGDPARILIEVAGVIVGAIKGKDRDKRNRGSGDIQSIE